MSRIIANMITKRAETILRGWDGFPQAANLNKFEEAWFKAAEALREEFREQNLNESASEVTSMIAKENEYREYRHRRDKELQEFAEKANAPKAKIGDIVGYDTAENSEPILKDDYPIYADYWYVGDGKPFRSDYHGVTAKFLKAKMGLTELRRCDMSKRGML